VVSKPEYFYSGVDRKYPQIVAIWGVWGGNKKQKKTPKKQNKKKALTWVESDKVLKSQT